MDILEKLFDNPARVKLMKFFLFHPAEVYDRTDLIKLVKINSTSATRELGLLTRVGMIKRKSFFKRVEYKRSDKIKKKRTWGYVLDDEFPYRYALHNLLITSAPMNEHAIARRVSKHGKIQLVITSGVFLQDENSRLDLLIVGDNMKEGPLKATIRTIESEIGTQLRYAVFNTKDFRYRVGVCDRLVRDILDYPHQKVVDKLGL